MTAPAPLFTTTVKVAGDEPTTSELAVTETVAVEPAMVMGICVAFPLAVAVIVAVRVATLVVPEENVTTALPVASLVADDAESTPVSAEKVIGTPPITALAASITVAVIVVVLLLSDATEVDVAASEIAAAVGTGATGVVGVVGVVGDDDEPPPPQAARRDKIPKAAISETARIRSDLKIVLLRLVLAVVPCGRLRHDTTF